MKSILFIFSFLLITGTISAQNTLEGKVMDTGGISPLPGASIYWAGTTRGTSTNLAGYFVLKKERANNKLVISFIGYKTDTLTLTREDDYIEHTLSQLAEIDEVTIIGRAEGSHIDRIEPIMTFKITGAELGKAACCNLSESFTTSASVDVSFSDAVTGSKQIQLLGLAGTYVQMMTENFPALYGLGTAYGLNYIPGTWMESIQISKGSASVRNGYEAITGQINVEFKKPATSEKLYLNSYANSSGKFEANMNSSIILNKHLSTAIFAHVEKDEIINDHNKDGFRDEPNVKQYHIFNRWDYLTETLSIRVGARYMEEERVSGQASFSPEGPDPFLSDYGILINTKRAEAFSKTGLVFPAKRNMSLGWINNFTYHDQEARFGSRVYTGTQKSYYSNLLYQWKPLLDKHTIDAGFSYKYDQYDESLDSAPLGRTESVPGAFLQYSYNDTALITLVAGIRADFHSMYGTFITPRFHLRYELTESTTLRASAGKGFRTTNVLAENQYLLASSRQFDIASDLGHEEAWNYGASLTSYLTLRENDLRLSAEYYHTRFVNQIITDLDADVNTVFFYNLDGRSFSNVLQFEAQWEPINRLDVLLAFRWNDVRMTTDGLLQQRALHSKYKGLISLSYLSNLRRWQYDLSLQINGPGRIPSTATNPPQYQREENFNPYSMINGQVTRKYKYWDIYLGVENLGNFKQKDPIIAADDPFSSNFDASLVWGPVLGRMFYGGLRLTINRK